MLVLLNAPLAYKAFSNYFKVFEIREAGIYFKEGFIFQKSTEIKYSKINEIKLHQNIVQKEFGAGNLVILTGNDTHTHLPGLEKVLDFKARIEEKIPQN